MNDYLTLARGASNVTIPLLDREPVAGYSRSQNTHRTAEGAILVYDRNVSWRIVTVGVHLTAAQRDNLLTFVNSVIRGALYTFTLTDANGASYANCRLMNGGELTFHKTPGQRYGVTLEIQVPEFPV